MNENWLVAEYATRSATDIAASIGTTKKVVVKYLRQYGCDIRNSYVASTNRLLYNRAWLYDQYHNLGVSLQHIAENLEVSRMSVQRSMKKLGIRLKSPYEYNISTAHITKLIPLLDKYDIKHKTSFPVEVRVPGRIFTYEVDEHLPEMKVFLELQGDYWHGYTGKTSKAIVRNRARDKKKLVYLMSKFPDHTMVYIRESEIETGVAENIIKQLSQGIVPKTSLPT